ncbi:MAG: protein translocase subunit SecD [Terriglobia bacterium]
MKPNLRWKAAVILALVGACLLGLFGFRKKDVGGDTVFYFPRSYEDLKRNLADRINLGLDLKGGMHLILQVKVEEAINSRTDQVVTSLRTQLREQDIEYERVSKTDATRVLVTHIPPGQLNRARSFLEDNYGGSRTLARAYVIGVLPGEQSGLVLEMSPTLQNQIRQQAVRDAIQIIRQRVDELGVAEPTIAEHGRGEWEILVQLPGVDDPNRVKDILQSTAMLEIKLVVDGPYASRSEALAQHRGILPPDTVLLPEATSARTGRQQGAAPGWYLLSRTSVVTGQDLRTARAQPNPETPGAYQVSFTLSQEGASRFGPFTERNRDRSLGVVLDNEVKSVATIQSRIDDAGRITGAFSLQEANDLALVLRSGALPASIEYLEERTVGPSLGADSIRAGLTAIGVGFLAVVVFMLFYYRLSGVNALVALVLNLVILLAALAYLGATLTLPGMAGILLTVGMAVDANVLVFERIREELRLGKAVVTAVETGFDRAFVTIFDTNVTTIIAAVFLFMFGTGPIKGFAVTLTLGLLANLFSAVYVSRAIFEYVLGRQARPAALSI